MAPEGVGNLKWKILIHVHGIQIRCCIVETNKEIINCSQNKTWRRIIEGGLSEINIFIVNWTDDARFNNKVASMGSTSRIFIYMDFSWEVFLVKHFQCCLMLLVQPGFYVVSVISLGNDLGLAYWILIQAERAYVFF